MTHRRPRLAGFSGVLGAAAALAPVAPAAAYDLMGVRWDDAAIPVRYLVNEQLSDDLSDAEALGGVQMGYEAWNALPCSSMRWEYGGRTSNAGWGVDDGENVVTFLNQFWDDSWDTLAITMTMWGGWGDAMSDADLKFNGANHTWAVFAGAPAGFADATDLPSVATHEVGHALGLNHSGVGDATMWPSVGPGDVGPRTLAADDIAGACAIYPTGQPAPDPDDLPPPAPPAPNDDPVAPPSDEPPTPPPPTPPEERGGFGAPCVEVPCQSGLMCITDQAGDTYCSRDCAADAECDAGYWCAPLAGGVSACARGVDDRPAAAGLGEACGQAQRCQAGLRCISDNGERYCAASCEAVGCPDGFACTNLASGEPVCARAENGLPTLGQPCTAAGRCAAGLICLDDAGVRYCTRTCLGQDCGAGAWCVAIEPEGSACQFTESAQPDAPAPEAPAGRAPTFGEACRFEPGAPACEIGLACVDTTVLDGTLVDPGYCTFACDSAHCCPDGYGCVSDVGGRGRCRAGMTSEDALACGAGGGNSAGVPGPVAAAEDGVTHRGSSCAAAPMPLAGLLLLCAPWSWRLRRVRPRRGRSAPGAR